MSTKASGLNSSPLRLAAGLEKSIAAYATAAAASGVSLLALTLPAAGRIVYTRANLPIPVNGGFVPLDLNHDGVADFSFSNQSRTWTHTGALLLQVAPTHQGNAIRGRGSINLSFEGFGGGFGEALRRGFTVGPSKSYFQKGKRDLLAFYEASIRSAYLYTASDGQWLQTKGRYLGLQFLIHGKVHYGWARVNVSGPSSGALVVTVTGYAYETIPNKPIVAGKTKGPDDDGAPPISRRVPARRPASLGMLALGSRGLVP